MKLFVSTLLLVGTLGAVAVVHDPEADDTLTTAAVERAKSGEHFRMRVLGREGSCSLVKHGPAEAQRAKLELDHNCVNLMPGLAEARYWREKAAGDVAFVTADGREIMEFFPGDGVAYESSYPRKPLIALTAQ